MISALKQTQCDKLFNFKKQKQSLITTIIHKIVTQIQNSKNSRGSIKQALYYFDKIHKTCLPSLAGTSLGSGRGRLLYYIIQTFPFVSKLALCRSLKLHATLPLHLVLYFLSKANWSIRLHMFFMRPVFFSPFFFWFI